MKITSFLHSKVAIITVALSLATSVQAAYHLTLRSRPTMSLERMMFPRLNRQSLFSRDVGQVMREFDQLFDSMAAYEPLAMQQRLMSTPSYSLPGTFDVSSLALGMPKQTYEIAQDEKLVQIKVNLPGIDPSDINLQVDEDNRLVKISGTSNHEDRGVSVHSSFERSFSLAPDVDTSNISAQMENGVLLISAPKKEGPKDSVRRISINTVSKDETAGVDTEEGAHETEAPVHPKKDKDPKTYADDTVIDLDVQ
jgi:HSP20 family protein